MIVLSGIKCSSLGFETQTVNVTFPAQENDLALNQVYQQWGDRAII